MKPIIREATISDVYQIRKFHADSWLDTYPNENAGVPEAWVRERWRNWDSPENLDNSRERVKDILADNDQLYMVATLGDKVVAILHVSRHTSGQELGALYVDKQFQGTGLAHDLMNYANMFWDERRPIVLAVVDYNMRARRFYEKQGFKKLVDSEYLHADIMPSIKMKREAKK